MFARGERERERISGLLRASLRDDEFVHVLSWDDSGDGLAELTLDTILVDGAVWAAVTGPDDPFYKLEGNAELRLHNWQKGVAHCADGRVTTVGVAEREARWRAEDAARLG